MSNSSLINYKKISPNKTSPRNHKIDTITIHCVAGQCSVETIGEIFSPSSRQASSNYAIGSDGRIGMYVEEKDRSWCTSSASNDHRAITIEVASDTSHPYAVKDKVLQSLINLVADVCKRNNIKKLLWENNKSLIGQVTRQNMTVHRWFSNTECPGQYLLDKHPYIVSEVNKILKGVNTPHESTQVTLPESTDSASGRTLFHVQVGAYKSESNAKEQLQIVKSKGFDAIIKNVSGLYKVQVGAYANKINAVIAQAKLEKAGLEAIIVKEGGGTTSTNAEPKVKLGSIVRVNKGAKSYTGQSLADFVYTRNHKVTSIAGNRAVISYNNVVVAAMNVNDLTVV